VTEIMFIGRGGQNVLAAARILASALLSEGRHVLAFPAASFSRWGAPSSARIRFDDRPVRLRCRIKDFDGLVLFDDTLLQHEETLDGLKKGGLCVINTRGDISHEILQDYQVVTIDASSIAVRHNLGSPSHPMVVSAMLGAFSRASAEIPVNAILSVIDEHLGSRSEDSAAALMTAYDAATNCR